MEKFNYKEQEVSEELDEEFDELEGPLQEAIALVEKMLNEKISKKDCVKYLLEHRRDLKLSKYNLAMVAGNNGLEDYLPQEYLDFIEDLY